MSYPDEQYLYFIAAEKFGWTPTEVDEQPAGLFDWLIAISTAVEKVKADKVDKKQSESRTKRVVK